MGTHLSPSDWWQLPGQILGSVFIGVMSDYDLWLSPALYLKSVVSTDHTKHVTAGRPVGRNLH